MLLKISASARRGILAARVCQRAQCVIVVACGCGCFRVCFSLRPCMSVCLCDCVCACGCVAEGVGGGGLMGSVGARVPGEQLSLIIQTRLIIKAAQISPWFHLNCRQAAPLRQAVVTLGWLSLSFPPPLHGPALLHSVLLRLQYLPMSQQDGPRLGCFLILNTLIAQHATITLFLNALKDVPYICVWLDIEHALFENSYTRLNLIILNS